MIALWIGCGFFSVEDEAQQTEQTVFAEKEGVHLSSDDPMERSKTLVVQQKQRTTVSDDLMVTDQAEDVVLDIQFIGMSDLYQRFFLDSRAQNLILEGLHEIEHPSPKVSILVEWIATTHGRGSGRIVMLVDRVFDLAGLEELARPLKAYHSYIGKNYDLRIMSFSLYLQRGECLFEVSNIPNRFDVSAYLYEGERIATPDLSNRRYFFSQQPQAMLCLSSDH
ncbi:MAG: hypothetical protein CMK59_15140 [Proteobacteria bacterium]|nr:hypothetical protein [Pseudomonadota bacterium]